MELLPTLRARFAQSSGATTGARQPVRVCMEAVGARCHAMVGYHPLTLRCRGRLARRHLCCPTSRVPWEFHRPAIVPVPVRIFLPVAAALSVALAGCHRSIDERLENPTAD